MPFPSELPSEHPAEIIDFDSLSHSTTTAPPYKQQQQHNNHNHNNNNTPKKKYSAVPYDYNLHNENERFQKRVFHPNQNRNFAQEQPQYHNRPHYPTYPRWNQPYRPEFTPNQPQPFYANTYATGSHEYYHPSEDPSGKTRKNLGYRKNHNGLPSGSKENNCLAQPFDNMTPHGSTPENARNRQQQPGLISQVEKVGDGAAKKLTKQAKKRAARREREKANSAPPTTDQNESNISPRGNESASAVISKSKPTCGKQYMQQDSLASSSTVSVADSFDGSRKQSTTSSSTANLSEIANSSITSCASSSKVSPRQHASTASSSNPSFATSSKKVMSRQPNPSTKLDSTIVSLADSFTDMTVSAPLENQPINVIERSEQPEVLTSKKKAARKNLKTKAAKEKMSSPGQNDQQSVDQPMVEDIGQRVPRETVVQKSKPRGDELLAFGLRADDHEPAVIRDGNPTSGKPERKFVLQPPILVAENLLPSPSVALTELESHRDRQEPAPVKKKRTKQKKVKPEETVVPQPPVTLADEAAPQCPVLEKSALQTPPASLGDAHSNDAQMRGTKGKSVPTPDGNRKKGKKGKLEQKSMPQTSPAPPSATSAEVSSQSPVSVSQVPPQSSPALQDGSHEPTPAKPKRAKQKKGKVVEKSTGQAPISLPENPPITAVVEKKSSKPLSALAKSFQSLTVRDLQHISFEPVAARDGNQIRRKKGRTEEMNVHRGGKLAAQSSMATGEKSQLPRAEASQPPLAWAENGPPQTPLGANRNAVPSGSSFSAANSYPQQSHGEYSRPQSHPYRYHPSGRYPHPQPYELYHTQRRSPPGQPNQYQGFPLNEPFYSGRTVSQQQDRYEPTPQYRPNSYNERRKSFHHQIAPGAMPGQHQNAYGPVQANRLNVYDEQRRSFQPRYQHGTWNAPVVMDDQQRGAYDSVQQYRPNSHDERRSSQAWYPQRNGPAAGPLPVSARQDIRHVGTERRRTPPTVYAPGTANYQHIQAYRDLHSRPAAEPRDLSRPRKLWFTEHLAYGILKKLLAENEVNKTYYSGPLRVNKKRRTDAYVAADGLLTDVYVPGNRLRNRAFDGDVVVVRIITEEEAAKSFPKEKFSLRMGGSLVKRIGAGQKEGGESEKNDPSSEQEEEDVDVSESDGALVGDEISLLAEDTDVDVDPAEGEKLFGEVVGILEISPFRKFAGTISLERPGRTAKNEAENGQEKLELSEKSENAVVESKDSEPAEKGADEEQKAGASEKIVVKGTNRAEARAKKTVRQQDEGVAVEPEQDGNVGELVKVAKKGKGRTSKGDKVKKVSRFEKLSSKRTPDEEMDALEASDDQAEIEVGPSEKGKQGKSGTDKDSKGVRTTTKRTPGQEMDESEPEDGEDVPVKVTKKAKGKGSKTGTKKLSKFERLAMKRTPEEETDASVSSEDESEREVDCSSEKVLGNGKGKTSKTGAKKGTKIVRLSTKRSPAVAKDALDTSEDEDGEKIQKSKNIWSIEKIESGHKGKSNRDENGVKKDSKAVWSTKKPNSGDGRDALDSSEDEAGEKIEKNQKVRSFEVIERPTDKVKAPAKAKVSSSVRPMVKPTAPDDDRDALDTSEDEAGNTIVKSQKVRTINMVETPAADQAKETGNNGNGMAIQRRSESRYVWFQPTDKRAPLMVLEAATVPREFIEDPESFKNHLYLVKVLDWPPTVQHPCARFIKDLGVMGEIKVETEALLQSNGVEPETFPNEVLNCLPKTPWTIPPIEFKTRRDMRNDRIFTIDPSTARDLDDAVSCRMLDDGNYEIGVHIADVSYFVRPKTPLDAEAMNRATTVYLVQQIVPMLPPLLCEQLCSLNPGVDRLAFSVIWVMTPNAKIVDTWFGRTIIRSACKLSYEHAQTVIEGGKLDSEIPLVGATAEEIESDILIFFELSKKLRSGRYEDGALSMNSIKLSFELDEDGLPMDCWVYQQKESNRLIEEFMLLANMSVAKKISSAFPEQALLRRHAPPAERRMNDFAKIAAKLGFDLDVTSAGKLQESFNELEREHGNEVVTVLKLLCIKPMMRAKYFCTGCLDIEKFGHYALNVPLYTHFTSPIRRYADVMVHRILDAALARRSRYSVDTERIQKIADNCNRRKDASKSAQDESGRLFLSALLHRLVKSHGGQPVKSEAIVIQVQAGTFDVLVPAYGVEARIHVEDLPLSKFTYDEKKSTLKLYWKKNDSMSLEERDEAEREGKNVVGDSYRDEASSRCQILKTLSRLTVALDATFKKSPPIINVSVPHPF